LLVACHQDDQGDQEVYQTGGDELVVLKRQGQCSEQQQIELGFANPGEVPIEAIVEAAPRELELVSAQAAVAAAQKTRQR